jgi:hypothetical protein
MFEFLIFVLILFFVFLAILIYREKKDETEKNRIVKLVSPDLVTLQRIQLELGTHEIPQWNGLRNELRLYRLSVKKSDADYALSRYRILNIGIEY